MFDQVLVGSAAYVLFVKRKKLINALIATTSENNFKNLYLFVIINVVE